MTDVIVIGGGAAGLIACVEAAKRGLSVILLEQNEKLGKKLYITGKGRCNFTNAAPRDVFFSNVIRNPRFLYSAYAVFDNQSAISLINDMGVETKIERGMRVFPASDKSSDIIRAFEKFITKLGVRIRLNTPVKGILASEGRIKGVETIKGETLSCGKVILCTGGLSYPLTGATGDGYKLASALGHDILKARPALVPLETRDSLDLSGLSLKNVTLSAYEKDKLIYRELGEMLFSHFGVTGPLVLSASSHMDKPEDVRLEIDLKPGLTIEQLDKRLLRDIQAGSSKSIHNALIGLLPKRLLPVVLNRANISGEELSCDLRREQRKSLIKTLKAFTLNVSGTRGFDEAVITRGGVNVREVNPKTMESKLLKGLFFAGEILDVDALTGGFNLQIAWSTGALAGKYC